MGGAVWISCFTVAVTSTGTFLLIHFCVGGNARCHEQGMGLEPSVVGFLPLACVFLRVSEWFWGQILAVWEYAGSPCLTVCLLHELCFTL